MMPKGTRARLLLIVLVGLSCLACAEQDNEPAMVADGPVAADPVRVRVVTPVVEDIERQVVLPARIEALYRTTLYSRVNGYLGSIEVDIGDKVSRGQIIAEIEVPEIVELYQEAKAELASIKASFKGAQAELERARAEHELQKITLRRIQAVREEDPGLMAQQKVDEVKAQFEATQASVNVIDSKINQLESETKRVQASMNRLQTLIDFAKVRVPFDGVVTERFVDPGTLLQPATSSQELQRIVTIVSMDDVRLFFDVPESEVPFVQARDSVVLTVDAIPDREFKGEITRFSTVLNPSTRTMRTEIQMPNPDWLLRPGMYGRATLSLERRTDAMMIPSDALRADGDATFIYCVVDGLAKRVDIGATVGDGIQAEVTGGLRGDERVVVSAQGPIRDGSPVQAVGGSSNGES